MGGCFSKPVPSRGRPDASPAEATAAVTAPKAGLQGQQQDEEQHGQKPSVQQSSSSVSATLPPVLEAWTAADVLTWAAGLGLGPGAAAALKGCTGEQLLQVTDKGLLQLGVQDAAERQALLTALKNFTQQQQQQGQQLQAAQQQATAAGQDDAKQNVLVLPAPVTPSAGPAGQGALGGTHTATGANGISLQDAQGDPEGSKKAGVRFAASPTHALAEQGSGAVGSGDLADSAEVVEQGETQDIQVLRITSAGRFFRHNRPVPLLLVPLCQAVCMLHDVRRGAHYHQDNCHHLLQRLILVQDYLLALSLVELLQHGVLLAKLSVLVQDVYDVVNQFSDRGWLLRLLGPVRDQDDFNRLDQQLVNALQQAGVDTSEPPLEELSAARMYQPQQQQLESALKQLGITRLMRDPLSATLRLQSLLNHLPSGSNIEVLLQQEIDYYLSSSVQLIESNGSDASADNGSGSRGGSDSSIPKGVPGSSAHTLRRSSSSGPLMAGRARAAAMAAVEPYMVLRNDTVRAEWRSIFGARERITWKEFWHKLVQPQAHIWGLDRQLDKFTTDYVQQHLQRGSHGLLTLSEMDFAFPPNVSPAMIVQARLKGHASVSSAGLSPVQFGTRSASSKTSRLPGGIGWLREVRHLQDPNPRLHNFPEFPSSYISRDDEVAELVLSMADVSTNLVMLTGAQGVGRSMLAASLAQELVSSQHWTDAYWVDMQGISNVVLAGQQLMAGLGLVSDVSDTQQLLAWLEGRPRERFGIVLTHVQDLVMAPAEEHQGFLDLLDNILHSSHKLQVVVVCEEVLPRITYSARISDVGPLTEHLAAEMVRDAQPDVSEEHCRFIVEVCSGAPVALSVVCNLLRYGHCNAAEFVRLYSDPRLPLDRSLSNTNTSFLPFESRATNERLQRVIVAAMVNLPDVLVGTLFVLSLLPSPFTLELFGPLLALAQTKTGKHAVLRRLVNLGLLSYNASLQQYSMHKVVREAARLLAHNLDLPFNETRTNYAERVVSTARRLVLPLIKKNRMLSARLAWSRLAVHVVQLLNWAFQEVKPELLPLYVGLAWDLTPLLSSCCSSHTLQGFCQVVLERSQFLDANLESAKMMTVLASLLAESGALKRADTLLRQALELFWRELKDPTPAVARCYRELGALMLKAGKAAEAAKHLQQALDIKEPLYGSTSPELLTVLQLQVELLRRSRKYAEAEHVCQRALGICGAAYGPSDVQVAFWKNQLAQVLRQAGRPSEAQSLSEEALSLLQGQLGGEHPRVAAQLMILGQLAAQQNKQAVAEQTFRKALQVYQSVSGLHHPDTFNCLTSLVALLRGAGKASQALPLAQRCLAVKKKSLGELHPDTAASMQVVADVMLDLGRYAEVEANCNRAVWVYQQINQPANSRPVITATTMQALALVLLGRASEAEQLATSCLEAAKQLPGPAGERNSFVASCFNCLGEVFREMGRLAESEAAAREGLAMREKDMGPEHPVVAISLQTLGHVLRLRQQLEEALEVARRCKALRSASSSQAQGPQMAAALYLQALIYSDMGDLDQASEKAQAALSMRQKVLSSDHPDLAHSLTAVAEIFLLQNKFVDAEPLLSHAVQIFIAQLGSSHPATQRAHALLKQANNPHTASSSISMAMRLASDSTDIGSSRLASRDLSRSASLVRQLSGPAAAPAAPATATVAATAAAAAGAVAAAAVAGSGAQPEAARADGSQQQQQQDGDTAAVPAAAVAAVDQAGRKISAGQAVEAELDAAGSTRLSKAGSSSNTGFIEHRLSDPQSTAGSPHSYATTGTNVAVSISTHIGPAGPQGASSAPGSNELEYLDMQQRNSLDGVPRAGSQEAQEAGGHWAEGLLSASSSGAAAAAAAAAARVAAAESGNGGVAPAEQAGLGPVVRSGSLGAGIPKVGSRGELAGSGGSGSAAAASTQANPAQWELGRQLGQPVALASGAAEPDTGAYNMVLAELTRRASYAGNPEDDKGLGLHEEGAPKAQGAAPKTQAGDRSRGPSASGMPPVPPARGGSSAGAAGAAAGAAAAAGAGAGTTLSQLSEATGSGDQSAAMSAAAAAVSAGAGGESEGADVGSGSGGGADEERGPDGRVFEKKMARLEGLADIQGLTAFLREHGWQLSRLSEDREGLSQRAQPSGTEGSDPMPAPAALAAAAAAEDGKGAGAAGVAEVDFAKSAPLPAAALDLAIGAGSGEEGNTPPGGPSRYGPFAAAAQQAQGAQQQQPQQQQTTYRRPPARHYSFVHHRSQQPVQLEAAWSAGQPPSPRSMRRGLMAGAGVPGYASPYEEVSGLQGQMSLQAGLAYQQQQRLQRPRVDPSAYDAVWPDQLDAEEDELARLYYHQQLEVQQLHAQEQGPWGQPSMHSRNRSFASQGVGSRTMTAADVAQVIEAMHQRYQPQYVDDDSFGAPAALGLHPAASGGLHGMHARQQLAPAWSAGLAQGSAGYGAAPPRSAAVAAAARGRTVRRRSFDAGAYRAAQAAQSSHNVWGQAAAAAAAECGYPLQLQGSSELEQLQLQQQHMSSLYAAAAQQQTSELAGLQHQQHHQQQHLLPPEYGSGASSNRGSGHSGSYGYGHQQLVAAAAALQGQQRPGTSQGPLSPEPQQQGLPGGASRAASSGLAGLPGMLPKYPSNMSAYSAVSASSVRSAGAREDAQGGGGQLGHAQGSGGSQHQGEEGGGGQGPGPPVPPSGRSSRLGTVSPEMGGSARQQDQQQQQQQHLVAARARSALGITRQGSGQSAAGGDMSPPSLLSPRPQQQGSGGATPTSSGPASARSARAGSRPNVTYGRAAHQQQQHAGEEHAADELYEQQMQQQHQQDMDVDSNSPRYAAAAGYRGAPAAFQQQRQQQQQQQLMGPPRTPLLAQQLQQQQQLYAEEAEHYGLLASQQQYLEAAAAAAAAAEEGGHWGGQGDMLHPSMAAALAASGGMSGGYHGPPPPPVQYPYMAGSGPASTGSAHQRMGSGSNYQRIAAALSAMGLNPHGVAGGGPASAQQQQQQQLLSLLQAQQAAAEWEAAEAEAAAQGEDRLESAANFMKLQQQVQNVQAARAELENQQHEIEAFLAFPHMSGPEQQQVLDMLSAQQQQQQQQQYYGGPSQQQQLHRPVSPHAGQLNVLGTGVSMGSSSSNVQVPTRSARGPAGQGPPYLPHGHPSGVSMSPHEAAAVAAAAAAAAAAGMGAGGYLQRATSTASTASLGSPKSAHSGRARAAAMALAAAGGSSVGGVGGGGRPSTPEQAAATAAAAAAEAAAAGEGGAGGQEVAGPAQLASINTNGSSAHSPSSTQTPGSPAGSRSTPSRSALSRGASGSYDGQLPPAAAGAGGGRAGTAGPGPAGKGALLGQRSISPDRLRRPASAAAVLGPQAQQKPLHRLHRDNSYDQQIGDAGEGPAGGALAGAQRSGSAGLSSGAQARSPTNHALRGPPAPGMPPMPVPAWQQQILPPQQYAQMVLAQQQQLQQQQLQQQQLQLLPQALPRRPARMSSPSPYATVAAPTSPMGLQGSSGSSSSYMPASASAVAAALAAQQQQQQQQQQFLHHSGSSNLAVGPMAHSGSRQGLQQGAGMGPAGAAGLRGPGGAAVPQGGMQARSAAAAAAAALRSPVGGRVPSYSAGVPARPLTMQQQQLGGLGMGYPAGGGYPAHMGAGSFGAAAQQGLTQQQMASLLLRQQQQIRQQLMMGGSAAAVTAMAAAAAAGGRGSFGGSSQPDSDPEGLQYVGLGGQGSSEDYGLWAAPPDYGGQVRADEASSRGASGNSRSFISPSGGQTWQGRRSNSWGNLPDAAAGGDITSPRSSSLPRSQSSQDMPRVLEGVTEAAPAQPQQQHQQQQAGPQPQ